MLWVKAFHIIFLVTWFSGLFYLPRLFVYHTMTNDSAGIERFKIMERKLYFGIMMPGMLFTLFWVMVSQFQRPSIHAHVMVPPQIKLRLAIGYLSFYLGYLFKQFKQDKNRHSHVFYRVLNEVPVLFLVVIVLLVVLKPSGFA